MPKHIPIRERRLDRVKRALLTRGNPRTHMFLMLCATGLAGFLASYAMHALGLTAMWLRYPLAVGMAYAVFLGLIYIWLRAQRRESRSFSSPITGTDVANVALNADLLDVDDYVRGRLVVADPSPSTPLDGLGTSLGLGGAKSGGGSGNIDAKGILIVVVVILILIAVGSALFAAVYVIWEAPALFAEVLVNGSLLVGLARRMRATPGEHWTAGVIRRTWIPAGLVALALTLVGAGLTYLVPGATELDPEKPTAVLLAGGYGGLGVHTLLQIERLFPEQFNQVIFISVGVVDSGTFKGKDEIEALEASIGRQLEQYVKFARNKLGWAADADCTVGAETVAEIERLCREVHLRFPRSMFFAGKLVFREPTWWHCWLHNETAHSVQRRLEFDGLPMVILPVRMLR